MSGPSPEVVAKQQAEDAREHARNQVEVTARLERERQAIASADAAYKSTEQSHARAHASAELAERLHEIDPGNTKVAADAAAAVAASRATLAIEENAYRADRKAHQAFESDQFWKGLQGYDTNAKPAAATPPAGKPATAAAAAAATPPAGKPATAAATATPPAGKPAAPATAAAGSAAQASGASASGQQHGRKRHHGGNHKSMAVAAAGAPNISDQGVGTITYQLGKHDLTAADKTALDRVAEAMKKDPTVQFDVKGHYNGKESLANMALAKERAQAAADYLTGKGVSADRLHVTAQIGTGAGLTTEFSIHKADAAVVAPGATPPAPPALPVGVGTVGQFQLDKRDEAYLHEHLRGVHRGTGFLGLRHNGSVDLSVSIPDGTDVAHAQAIKDGYANALSQKQGFNPKDVAVHLSGEPGYNAANAIPYKAPPPMGLAPGSEDFLVDYAHQFPTDEHLTVSVKVPTGLSRLQQQEARLAVEKVLEREHYHDVEISTVGVKNPPVGSAVVQVTPGGVAPTDSTASPRVTPPASQPSGATHKGAGQDSSNIASRMGINLGAT